jgi:ABC-type phosphate/phosphonate transport system substrate-binding protein
MREYKNFCGDIVDLNDDQTYDHLPQTASELRRKIWEEIGYCHLYFTYWHPDWPENQVDRVEKMIYHYAQEDKNHLNDVKWLREWLYKFEDEIENMC